MTSGHGGDKNIPNDEDLYRRIAKNWIVPSHLPGKKRIVSLAFKERNNEISVDLSSLVSPEGCLSMGGPNIIGVAAVTAGQVRDLGQQVVQAGTSEDPAHALICGPQGKIVPPPSPSPYWC